MTAESANGIFIVLDPRTMEKLHHIAAIHDKEPSAFIEDLVTEKVASYNAGESAQQKLFKGLLNGIASQIFYTGKRQ